MFALFEDDCSVTIHNRRFPLVTSGYEHLPPSGTTAIRFEHSQAPIDHLQL